MALTKNSDIASIAGSMAIIFKLYRLNRQHFEAMDPNIRMRITSPAGARLSPLPGMRLDFDLQRLSWLTSYSIVNKSPRCFRPEMSRDPLTLIWMNEPIRESSAHVLMTLPQDMAPICFSLLTVWYVGKYLLLGRNTPRWLPAMIAASILWRDYCLPFSSLDYGLYIITLAVREVSMLVGYLLRGDRGLGVFLSLAETVFLLIITPGMAARALKVAVIRIPVKMPFTATKDTNAMRVVSSKSSSRHCPFDKARR